MEKNDKKIWKKWWFLFIIILAIIILLFIEKNTDNDNSNRTNNEMQSVNTYINKKTKENEYAEDYLVNKFIKDFKATSNYELTDIKKGNIRTKYFAYINGQYCEFINSTESLANSFNITIYGGNKEEDINKIISVYKEVIKTLDSTISETNINDTIISHIKNPSSSYNITDGITVKFYPFSEVSYNCRIEITTTIYN